MSAAATPTPPAAREWPLSLTQREMWFHCQLHPGSALNNICGRVRLYGRLDVSALQAALDLALSRHAALRAAFVAEDGVPRQLVDESARLECGLVELDALPAEEREARAEAEALALVRLPFDLSRAPLLRARLLRLSAEEHVLAVVFHHMVLDGFHWGQLLEEIAQSYDALCSGRAPDLQAPVSDYGALAGRQAQRLDAGEFEQQAGFWRQQLRAPLPATALPSDRPAGARRTTAVATLVRQVPCEIARGLSELRALSGVTVYRIVLAAYQVLAARLSGQREALVGLAFSMRPREARDCIGCFANTLPLRVDVGRERGFDELLAEVDGLVRQAAARRETPMSVVLSRLDLQRDTERPLLPLCSSQVRTLDLAAGGLSWRGEIVFISDSTLDFLLMVRDDEQGVQLNFTYATELYDEATVARYAEGLLALLVQVARDPHVAVSRLDPLPASERALVVEEWSRNPRPYPEQTTIRALVEARVRERPEAEALAFGARRLTYAQLDRRANALACLLLARGTRPDRLVPLLLERSLEMPLALLGVLKAGAAYAPLEPGLPARRLGALLEQIDAPLLLTQRALAGEARAAGFEGELLCLDELEQELAQGPGQGPPESSGPDHLAYVNFTSGSTGQPKGVLVPQRGVVRLVADPDYMQWRRDDVVLQVSTYAWDAATFEVWGALANGARLVLVPRETVLDFRRLSAVLKDERVSVMYLTAALFNRVIDEVPEALDGLRVLIVGGETASVPHFRKAAERLPLSTVINEYGPTENTSFSTWERVHHVPAVAAAISIGGPLSNSSAYVLDDELRPQPIGVPGELYLGGAGLARGYLGRADLTAERFVPHPFEPGARLYRSGDLARWRADGRLDFLGRLDAQVKLRGFRIELGEIEAQLREHASVQDAAVAEVRDAAGEHRLVAYVAADAGLAEELRALDDAQVSGWRDVFEKTYREGRRPDDAAFDIVGWDSSYTGAAYAPEAMREWVDATLARIRALRPERVLEIGCGTGLLLLRLAGETRHYCGVDFSPAALAGLRAQVERLGWSAGVRLLEREADRLDDLEPASFDTVVINSVAQYFPDARYLRRVLAQAVAALRPGGHVFLGDLRNLRLVEAFHASVELAKAETDTPAAALCERVRRRVFEERELLVAPSFFDALREDLPRVTSADLRVKRGRERTEMSLWRFDALLHVGCDCAQQAVAWRDWRADGLSLERLRSVLSEQRPPVAAWHGVPNARVAADVAAWRRLGAGAVAATAGELRRAGSPGDALEPEDLHALAEETGYALDLTWADDAVDGSLEAAFVRLDAQAGPVRVAPRETAPSCAARANNPLQARLSRRLAPELRGHLRERLPEYMHPAAYVFVDALPLTAIGKVDRRALPPPPPAGGPASAERIEPRSQTEARLAEIFRDVLGLESVGVGDDFFALGGHSLKAVEARFEIRRRLGIDLPLRSLFEAPTVEALAPRVEQAAAESAREEIGAIPRLADAETYAASRAQRRLWILGRLEPDNPAFNVCYPLRLTGPLDVPAWRRALRALVERQAVLRTTFAEHGEPLQVIGPVPVLELPVEDLTPLGRERALAALDEAEGRLAAQPFDLGADAPFRARLFRLGDEEHCALLASPHVALDNWSLRTLLDDLAALYAAECRGVPSPLPELRARYVDYASWHNTRLASGALDDCERHWLERLSGLAELRLPADHERRAGVPGRAHAPDFELEREAAERLRALGRAQGATLFMVQLAAVQGFLARLTGQDDVAVGTPSAGRDHPDTAGLVGFFVNPLLLRTSAGGDPTFEELVRRAKDTALDAFAHAELPFDRLVERLNPERDASTSPLFQVLFGTGTPLQPRRVQGLELRARVRLELPFNVALNLGYLENPDGSLWWRLMFDAERFEQATAERLARQFAAFLADVAARPEARLSEFTLLDQRTRAELELRRGGERDEWPLALNQRDMWLQEQLHGAGLNNVGARVAIEGPLDPGLFGAALQAAVARQDALRAVFVPRGADAAQRLLADPRVECAFDDLEALPAAEAERELRARVEALARAPFDLERGPALRARLVRHGDGHTLLLAFHHIVLDAFHWPELLREVGAAYQALRAGEPLPASERPRYVDYAAWQEARLRAGLLGESARHWRRELRLPLPSMTLPADLQPPARRSFATRNRLRPVSGAGREECSARLGTTPFRAALAAFAVLLQRLTGEDDVLLAMPLTTRPAAMQGVPGFFGNTLPLRLRPAAERRFAELVRDIDEAVTAARRHSEYPLTELFRELKLERNPSRSPLPFCASQIRTLEDLRAGDLVFRCPSPITLANPFDLWLYVSEGGGGLQLGLSYAEELFRDATAERLLAEVEGLLAAALARPDARLRELFAQTGDRRARVAAGGGRAATFDFLAAFAAQAESRPDAEAVSADGRAHTYAELRDGARAAAAHLRALGAGPEERVGLFGRREFGMLRALLGALTAGAAFVPLDPGQPDARLVSLLRASSPKVVACDAEQAARAVALVLAAGIDARVACWADELPAAAGFEEPRVAPRHLAAVFYTSGSTGAPKGAMVERDGMFNHLRAKLDVLGLGPGDAVLQNASHCFDISVWQFLAALAAGGRVVICDGDTGREPGALLDLLGRERVSVLETVPTLLDLLVQALETRPAPRALRVVVSNAETLPVPLARRCFERLPGVRLLNTYGATECSDDTTHHVMDAPPAADLARVPVGRSIAGLDHHVVDECLRPVAAGFPGQIAMSGAGVGRGYLGDPAGTARAFVPDPFASRPGARLYLSGDLGRLDGDGELQFLGRRDGQVKVRGHRVELGEIEAALLRQPGVRQACVAWRAAGRGGRLLAYVVGEASLDAAELRARLASELPAYMLPEACVLLPALPLNRNGKVDRAALPEPTESQTDAYVAPRDAREALIAAVWAEVLGRPRVGVADNFFDLGGDSIQSILVVSRLAQRGLRVTAKQLFLHQTVAELARVAEDARDSAPAPAEAPREARLLPIQELFFQAALERPAHFNMPLLLRAEGLRPDPLRRALQALAARHDALRLRFRPGAGGWRQALEGDADVPLEVLDWPALDAARLTAECVRAQTGLDLARGPLFRALLFRGGADGDRLLLVAHHLVVDWVSWRILLEDLERSYERALQGRDADLPAVSAPVTLWAERLRALPCGAADAAFWHDLLAQAPALPVDCEGDGRARLDRHVPVACSERLTQALFGPARQAYRAEAQDLMLAALASAHGRWSGQAALGLFVEGHGREALPDGTQAGRTVGWLTQVHPVALPARADGDRGAHLKRVKQHLRETAERARSFGLWRCATGDPGDGPRVSFNYLGGGDGLAGGRFALASEDCGPSSDARNTRALLLGVEARLTLGRLRVEFHFDERRHRPETIAALAQAFEAELEALVAFCLEPGRSGRTPSDFPLLALDQRQVDVLPAQTEDAYPLAPVQEGMLFHALFEPASPLYSEQAALGLLGPLDPAALRRAWALLIAAHPALRSVFRWEGLREPAQVVLPPWEPDLGEEDLSALDARSREARLEGWRADDWARPYALDSGPLLRFKLFRLAPDEWRFYFGFHHILLDGWSMTQVLADLAAAYRACLAGRAWSAPPRAPYRDYLAWLRRQDADGPCAYWRDLLAGAELPTPLPLDRRPAPRRARTAGEVELVLDAATTRAFEELARASRATLATAAQALWALLLARTTGTRDVVFGCTVSGRPPDLRGAETSVGLFINALPLRARLAPGDTFVDLLARLGSQAVEARAREHSRLADVQRALGLAREQHLFDSLFIFDNYPVEGRRPELGAARLELIDVREFTHYDLTLNVTPGHELRLRLGYARDVLGDEGARRLRDSLGALAVDLVARPQAAVDDLALFDAVEQARLLQAFNPPASSAPERFVPELFERRVAETPGAVAALCDGASLTYAELDRRANRVAHWLRARGITREARVGLFGRRGLGMLETMLGVLKAGAAFVPLDPKQPDARLASMLETAGLALIATQGGLAERTLRLAQGAPRPPAVLCWDEAPAGVEAHDALSLARQPDAAPPLVTRGRDLAYVLYTSGSTGQPKGVMVEQAGMLNHIHGKIGLVDLHPGDLLMQGASHCFDTSVWQFLAPLVVGAALVIYDDDTAVDPGALLAASERDGVTVLETVPAVLQALIECAGPRSEARLPALKIMMSNAEALPLSVCRAWTERFPAVPLINAYGPTECSDDVTHLVVSGPPPADWERVPVGRAIPGMQVYVLDDALRPVPQGCVGQVAMGGVGVGRGYLGDPLRTARAFVPDPFGAPGSRLYLTGDRARWTHDGQLDYVDRTGRQVKLRGQRIELGEIESALRRHPGLRQAVAVLHGAGAEARLVAYVVGDADLTPAALRAFLADYLPGPMLPDVFVALAALPLNRSGKVDRAALPAPPRAAAAEDRVAPRTPLEAQVAEVWSRVLGVPEVGAHDDFFALGGHSLLAIRLVAALRTRLGAGLALRQVFTATTVAEQAALLADGIGSGPAPIPRAPDAPHYPLSFAQRAQWLAHQLMQGGEAWWRPLNALELEGPLDLDALRAALHDCAERHEALRTSFHERAGEPVQVIHARVELACALTDLSTLSAEAAEEELRRLVEAETRAPIDLSRPSLWRLRLVRRSASSHVLLMQLPHIVSDGWTTGHLTAELARLYAERASGREPSLPGPAVRYVDYALWQRGRLQSPEWRAQREYWLERFASPAPALALGRPAAPGAPSATRVVTRALPDGCVPALRGLALEAGTTLFGAALGSLQALLGRLSGQADVTLGTPVAGRIHPDLEGVVGPFINALALRVDLSGGPGLRALLGRVRAALVEALARQDEPFEAWLDELRRRQGRPDFKPFGALFYVQERAAAPDFGVLRARLRSSLAYAGTPDSYTSRLLVGHAAGFELFEDEVGWHLMAMVDTARFRAGEAEAVLLGWSALIEQALVDPDAPLDGLALPPACLALAAAWAGAEAEVGREEWDEVLG